MPKPLGGRKLTRSRLRKKSIKESLRFIARIVSVLPADFSSLTRWFTFPK